MKRTFWAFAALIIPLITTAENNNTFSSYTVGFSITKPEQWHFISAAANADNLNNVRIQDEKFQKIMQKYATVPLVIMTKFMEPYDDLNPSVKVNIKPLGNMDGENPVNIMKIIIKQFPRILKNYVEMQSPVEREIAGSKAAYMKAYYSVENSAGRTFRVCSELWIIPRGKFFFLIGIGTKQDSDKNELQEIANIISSIKIDKEFN